MKTYEFSTRVTSDGRLVIPTAFAKEIPAGGSVKVIVLINDQSGVNENISLQDVTTEIKNSPQNPANIKPASGLLAQHLLDSPEEADPSFDLEAWEQEWDKVEALMKAIEIADQNSEIDVELA